MHRSPIQVYLVDDEPSVGSAYARLFRSAKMQPHVFRSVEEFMSANCPDDHACVICDVRLNGTSGLDLPLLLEKAGRKLPVILVSAYDTPEVRETARRVGAAAFFRKPVDDQALLDAIEWALTKWPGPVPVSSSAPAK
ncbi:MAG TPA: response regulator [Verrucomicrobiaceae bacterium]